MKYWLRPIADGSFIIQTAPWLQCSSAIVATVIALSIIFVEASIFGYILLLISALGAGYQEKWHFDKTSAHILHTTRMFIIIKKTMHAFSSVQELRYEKIHVGPKKMLHYSLLFSSNKTIRIELRNTRTLDDDIAKLHMLATCMNVACNGNRDENKT